MSAAEKPPQLREPQLRALAARAQESFFQRAAEARRVPVRFLVALAADLVQLRQEAYGVKQPGVQRSRKAAGPLPSHQRDCRRVLVDLRLQLQLQQRHVAAARQAPDEVVE